ncbi:MAG: Rab family GTPase [Promethearchaeota archaeon]
MAEKKNLFTFKITVVGEGRVGKTSLIQKFTNNSFNEDYLKTLGASFSLYENEINNDAIKLIIWDIAGQDDFNFLRPSFFKNSRASIIVCSLEENDFGKESCNRIADWHKDVRHYCGDDVPVLLLANKSDLVDLDKIDLNKLQTIVDRENFIGFYVKSAKTGNGVISSFNTIIRLLYNKSTQISSN